MGDLCLQLFNQLSLLLDSLFLLFQGFLQVFQLLDRLFLFFKGFLEGLYSIVHGLRLGLGERA